MSSLWRILAVAWLGGVASPALSGDTALANSSDPRGGDARPPRQIVIAADAIDDGMIGRLGALVPPRQAEKD
jgi:L-aminopeptidase/D-esterase-like protein